MTTDISLAFITQSRRLLKESYLPRIERCVEKLSDEQLWWRANPDSNSVGNLVLHLAGNVGQWIISGIGGASDGRDRQREFDQRETITGSELLLRIRTTVGEADRVLANVSPAILLEQRTIQGYEVTVFQAIYAVTEHFSMHTGQIILLTKVWKGDLAFYDLSTGSPQPTWQGGKGGD